MQKLRSVVAKKITLSPKSVDVIRALLGKQDAYTLHRPSRKPFARNPYAFTKVMVVRECDFSDYRPMQNIMKITGTFYLP